MIVTYCIPLRPDCNASLHVPRDLTPAEAERLAGVLRALAVPGPAPCTHPVIVNSNCDTCGAFVGPQG